MREQGKRLHSKHHCKLRSKAHLFFTQLRQLFRVISSIGARQPGHGFLLSRYALHARQFTPHGAIILASIVSGIFIKHVLHTAYSLAVHRSGLIAKAMPETRFERTQDPLYAPYFDPASSRHQSCPPSHTPPSSALRAARMYFAVSSGWTLRRGHVAPSARSHAS